MALEAVVFPQGSFAHRSREWHCAMAGGPWSCGLGEVEEEEKAAVVGVECEVGDGSATSSGGAEKRVLEEGGTGVFDWARGSWAVPSCTSLMKTLEQWDVNSSSPESETGVKDGVFFPGAVPAGAGAGAGARRKRRRTRSCKNKEEVENQRMTHIAIERNRRKQMNEYLSVLRSLMPPSYVQRGDQASIIGGAINYVKELEQLLQSLEAHKRIKQQQRQPDPAAASTSASASASGFSFAPFSRFFTFPQYSSSTSPSAAGAASATTSPSSSSAPPAAENRPPAADIEVTMVENHANLKVLSQRRPKQLLRLVAGLQGIRLSVLHLNVTTVDQMVLYSFSLRVEEDCQLSSVDEIATAVHQMLGKMQEETGF